MSHKVSKSTNKVPTTDARAGVQIPDIAVRWLILAGYLVALIYNRNLIPDGINNDVAEEALRGLYLTGGRHFEVITFAVGNSAETLYLYAVGLAAAVIGTSTLAIQVVSWICALASIWLAAKAAKRINEDTSEWIAMLAAASSLWLFHYARSGPRAICAPLFLGAFTLLLDRAERRPQDRVTALLCGGVLGLSIYGYTSDRAIAIAFAGYALWRVWRGGGEWARALQRYAWITAGALVVSIPNLVFFVQRPADFLTRGSYVLRGGMAERLSNVVWSALFPFYLRDSYRTFAGPGFQFDGVGAGFTGAGFNPIPLVFAAALVYGLWRARSAWNGAAASFLLAAWAATMLTVGLAGPSPTRLLILFPFYLGFAAAGFGFAMRDWPKLRIPIVLLMAGVGVVGGFEYLQGPAALSQFYAGAATAVGREASQLAGEGNRVICVVSGEADVVRYLTYKEQDRVKIVEFYRQAPDPAAIPFDQFPGGVLLLERAPQFAGIAARFPADWVTHEERFDRIRLPRA